MQKRNNKYLVINPFGIGDVIFSTPLLRNLAENIPEAEIYYLCNRRTHFLLKNHPLIKKVFMYERDEFEDLKKKSRRAFIRKWLDFIADIKKERIGTAIDLSLNSLYGFLALAAGIKYRVGLNYKKRSRFLNRKINFGGFLDKHVAEYHLDVLRYMGMDVKPLPMEIYPSPESQALAKEFLRSNGLSNNNIIGIVPCGGQAFGRDNDKIRRWPKEKFSQLIDELIEKYKAKIFIFAGAHEKQDVDDILNNVKHKESCYEFTKSIIDVIVALMQKCSLVIGNNTGPLRFADALGKKTIELAGPVDPKVYGVYPFDEKKNVIISKDLDCSPCYKKFRINPCERNLACLEKIEVDEVMDAVKQLIG